MPVESPPVQGNRELPPDTGGRGATRRPLSLAGVLSLLAWGLLCCSLLGFLGRLWWVLDLTSHFRVQYLVVAGVLGLLALCLRRWTLLLPVSFCLFVNLYLICPFYVGGPTAETPPASLRVMAINVNAGNRQREIVLDTITNCHPDVLFVLEYTEFWQEALAPLESTYPHTRQVPQDDSFGMAVYSRWPLAQAEVFSLRQAGFWAIEVRLRIGDQPWTILGIHVMPPVSARASQLRNEQLVELSRACGWYLWSVCGGRGLQLYAVVSPLSAALACEFSARQQSRFRGPSHLADAVTGHDDSDRPLSGIGGRAGNAAICVWRLRVGPPRACHRFSGARANRRAVASVWFLA